MPAERSGIWGCRRPRAAAAAPRARSAPCQGRRVPAEPASPLPPPRPAPHRLRPAPTPAAHGHTSRCLSVLAPPGLLAPHFAAPPALQPTSLAFFPPPPEIRLSEGLKWAHTVKCRPEVSAPLFSHLPAHPRRLPHSAPHPGPASARPCLPLFMILISPSRFLCFSLNTLKTCLLLLSPAHASQARRAFVTGFVGQRLLSVGFFLSSLPLPGWTIPT